MFVVSEQNYPRKTALQIKKVAFAAQILQDLFNEAESLIRVGMRPLEYRRLVLARAIQKGAQMHKDQISFCRYGYVHPSCDDDTPLEEGEVFTLDMWISWHGWYADLARPYCLLHSSLDDKRLYYAALACQQKSVQTIQTGKPYVSLVEAVQEEAQRYGCYVIENACGHGIGRNLHEDPMISFSYTGKNLADLIPADVVVTLEVALSLTPCTLVEDRYGHAHSHDGQTILYAEAMVALYKAGKELLGC